MRIARGALLAMAGVSLTLWWRWDEPRSAAAYLIFGLSLAINAGLGYVWDRRTRRAATDPAGSGSGGR